MQPYFAANLARFSSERVRGVERLPLRALHRRRAPVRRGADRFRRRGVDGVEPAAVHPLEHHEVAARVGDRDGDRDLRLLGFRDCGGRHLARAGEGQALRVRDVHAAFSLETDDPGAPAMRRESPSIPLPTRSSFTSGNCRMRSISPFRRTAMSRGSALACAPRPGQRPIDGGSEMGDFCRD